MKLLHELVFDSADRRPSQTALYKSDRRTSYAELASEIAYAAAGLVGLGIERHDRVAVYLPKQIETVVAMFAASLAGAIFVPINPVLKPAQVGHILRDSGATILITSPGRAETLAAELAGCPALLHVVHCDGPTASSGHRDISWRSLLDSKGGPPHRVIDMDPVAVLYTSGSTGRPKGVVLSHRNMVAGAHSVSTYLENTSDDRLLAVLPFSFDYGFSQLSTAFLTGAGIALIDYLLPRDVLAALDRYEITGLAAVPPLWIQLAALDWPASAARTLRYVTNSGGAMPQATLATLREKLPSTQVFLMYGLTEAFRSTYLPPDQVDTRPTSMGKAIPNAEVLVVGEGGRLCAPGEPGELVHRGALVSLGYWNDPQQTAVRFKPVPIRAAELTIPELAVWSGDTVVMDDEGYLYFVGRRDEMIKTSGYRVSPTEIEEVLYGTSLIAEAVAVGAPHPVLGHAIVVIAVPVVPAGTPTDELLAACRKLLPSYMVPLHVDWRESLPRNANGKIDRPTLAAAFRQHYTEAENG